VKGLETLVLSRRLWSKSPALLTRLFCRVVNASRAGLDSGWRLFASLPESLGCDLGGRGLRAVTAKDSGAMSPKSRDSDPARPETPR
jgi:hypothetical protein